MQLQPLPPSHYQAGCGNPKLVLFDTQSHQISTAGFCTIACTVAAIGKHLLFGLSPTEFYGWGAGYLFLTTVCLIYDQRRSNLLVV